jgi:uncharacterized membrane protein
MKKFAPFLVFGFMMLMISVIGSFLGFEDIKINKYTADLTINESGDLQVSERWDMVYSGEYSVRFRDIRYNKYADGYPLYKEPLNTASFDEQAVSVRVFRDNVDITSQVQIGYSFENDRDEFGNVIRCEPYSLQCESLFVNFSFAGGLYGNISFVYEYTIKGAITQYSDVSELNWRLFDYMESKVQEAEVNIYFPVNSNSIEDYYVFGHGLSKGTINLISNNRVQILIDEILKTEYLEFRILTPTNLFPQLPSKNKVIQSSMNLAALLAYETDLAAQTNLRILVAQVLIGLSGALVVLMIFVTYKVYLKYDKEYTPAFQAQYFRDLPSTETPAEVGYLFHMQKVSDEDVTATLLDLIRRRFISIEYLGQDMTSKDADFTMTLDQGKATSELLPHETHLLKWFFQIIGDGKTVSTKTIEGYGKKGITQAERFQKEAREFVRLAKTTASKHDYFEKTLSTDRSKAMAFIAIPIVFGIATLLVSSMFVVEANIPLIVSVVLGVAYAIYVAQIKKRSVNGNELYAKWNAFKNFMLDFGNMKDYPIPAVTVWEHYIVYATSFKIADQVMDQLRVKLPPELADTSGATYMGLGYGRRGFYYGYALGRFNQTLSTARTNSLQTISAHHAKASGGRGGGFGGGSSFGGGGGGGRSR